LQNAADPAVLAVDNCPEILTLLGHMLRHLGFAPLLASSGEEAVEAHRRHRGRVSAVLVDVAIPGALGSALCEALRQTDPGVRLCLMGGGRGHLIDPELFDREGVGFLPKPFSLGDLAKAVRPSATAST